MRWIVDETLEMVELTKLAGSVVGEAGGDWGLSTEQRKRLSIAVELVANPSVVFMVRAVGPKCLTQTLSCTPSDLPLLTVKVAWVRCPTP